MKNDSVQNSKTPFLIRDLPSLKTLLSQEVGYDGPSVGLPEPPQSNDQELLRAGVVWRHGPWARGEDDVPQCKPLAFPRRRRRSLSRQLLDLTIRQAVKRRNVPVLAVPAADVVIPGFHGGESLLADGAEIGAAMRRPHMILDIVNGRQVMPRQACLVPRFVHHIEGTGEGAGPRARMMDNDGIYVFGVGCELNVHVRV